MSGVRSQELLQRDCVEEFAHHLVTAVLNLELHPPGSTHVESNLDALMKSLHRAVELGVEMPLRLQFGDDLIHYDGQPLEGPSLQARRLLRLCEEREIAMLAFGRFLNRDELHRFLELLLSEYGQDAMKRSHRDRALLAYGIHNVRVTSRVPGDPQNRRAAAPRPFDRSALRSYQELADTLQSNHVLAHNDSSLRIDEASGAVERTVMRLAVEPSGLLHLATHDNIDRFTVGHSVRVALLALQVARAAGAHRDQLVRVGTAALLHDIGKSKVPQEILFKQGPLDEKEWEWMARHPQMGAEILVEQPELDLSAIGAAFCHHMRPCGAGYPRPQFPVVPGGLSRMIRVCDVFEALTSVRPYKRALTAAEAYTVMFRHQHDYDLQWLQFFVQTLGVYPQGTRLLLNDGHEAVVVSQGDEPHRPVVRILSGPDGSDLPAGHPDTVAIGVEVEGHTFEVLSVLHNERIVQVGDLEEARILTQNQPPQCR